MLVSILSIVIISVLFPKLGGHIIYLIHSRQTDGHTDIVTHIIVLMDLICNIQHLRCFRYVPGIFEVLRQ